MKTNPIYTIANSGLKILEWGTTAEKTLRFNENVYSLTINPSLSGTASADAMIGTENYQTYLQAKPLDGARLSGWNVTGGTITNNIFTFGNSDAIVEPVFEEYVVEEVTIGNQTWMAKNLAYDDGGEGIHHEGVTANGVDLGEQYYYNSAAMIRISSNFPGWHLPNYDEVTALSSFATAGSNYNRLRSEEGWSITPGTNDYGFNLYPAGNYNCVDVATGMLDGISTQANILLTHSVGFARARFTDSKRTSNISDLTSEKAWGWWYNVRLIKDTP